MQPIAANVLDRLAAVGNAGGTAANCSAEQWKHSIASDLERLLNTRATAPQSLLERYSHSRSSILAYGLADFSHLSVKNARDRAEVLSALRNAITTFEPRLKGVEVIHDPLRQTGTRLVFTISARLSATAAGEPVFFDALLLPTTRKYLVGYGNPCVQR